MTLYIYICNNLENIQEISLVERRDLLEAN